MAEANSCESCGFLEVKTFDMTKLEVEVIPDDQVAEGAREMRRLGRKLAKKKGLTKRDKKLRKIMKELIILLGHGQQVNSIPEAVAALLERNYPDLVKWNGDKKLVIFIPDFYLNKAVKYVNPNRGDEVLENLEEAAELHPERKEEFMKHRNALIGAKRVHRGEVPEVNMYNALTERFDKGDETVTIFHGLNITKFDLERQDNNVNEKDFVLLSETYKYIAVIECKKTLDQETLEKSLQQLADTKSDLESYLRNAILADEEEITSDWMFAPFIYHEESEDGINFCDACREHIIKGKLKYF